MKNTVLPDLDRETIERLKERFPDLSNIDLPKMEDVGKTADQTIDRLMGRSRAPIWPWFAVAFGLAAVIGTIAAYLAWFRRPPLDESENAVSYETETSSTSESLNGTDPYRSSVDRAWPTEQTTDVMAGTEGA